MDGNRTHPGRLNSAPQTVLKTAFLTSIDVRRRPLPIEFSEAMSAGVRTRAPVCTKLAVSLAVRSRASQPKRDLSAGVVLGMTILIAPRSAVALYITPLSPAAVSVTVRQWRTQRWNDYRAVTRRCLKPMRV